MANCHNLHVTTTKTHPPFNKLTIVTYEILKSSEDLIVFRVHDTWNHPKKCNNGSITSQRSTRPYMFPELHPPKRGNLWVIQSNFHDACHLKFFRWQSPTCLAFPLCQATVVLRYGQLPVGGSPSGTQGIFEIWISTPPKSKNPPNKLKLEAGFLSRNCFILKQPLQECVFAQTSALYCISLRIFWRNFSIQRSHSFATCKASSSSLFASISCNRKCKSSGQTQGFI